MPDSDESEHKLNQNQDVQGEKLVVEAKSVALLRLIDEVRFGEDIRLDAYNRVYSRHNRSI